MLPARCQRQRVGHWQEFRCGVIGLEDLPSICSRLTTTVVRWCGPGDGPECPTFLDVSFRRSIFALHLTQPDQSGAIGRGRVHLVTTCPIILIDLVFFFFFCFALPVACRATHHLVCLAGWESKTTTAQRHGHDWSARVKYYVLKALRVSVSRSGPKTTRCQFVIKATRQMVTYHQRTR